jgi:hypothetical protein
MATRDSFPRLSASDLEGRRYELPDDLPPGPRLVVLPFQRWQQVLVEGWKAAAEPLRRERPDLTVWEVPSLSRGYRVMRGYIDGGMRAGIPDEDVRRHTLTTYTDLRLLADQLALPTFDTVYAFLLDGSGRIAWRGEGEADEEQVRGLAEALGRI